MKKRLLEDGILILKQSHTQARYAQYLQTCKSSEPMHQPTQSKRKLKYINDVHVLHRNCISREANSKLSSIYFKYHLTSTKRTYTSGDRRRNRFRGKIMFKPKHGYHHDIDFLHNNPMINRNTKANNACVCVPSTQESIDAIEMLRTIQAEGIIDICLFYIILKKEIKANNMSFVLDYVQSKKISQTWATESKSEAEACPLTIEQELEVQFLKRVQLCNESLKESGCNLHDQNLMLSFLLSPICWPELILFSHRNNGGHSTKRKHV